MYDLQEIEAIKRLKYQYIRTIDCKQWDELRQCFTDDARSDYHEGEYRFDGADQIVKFIRDAHGAPTWTGYRRSHNPEIDVTGPTTAVGVWAIEYVDYDLKAGLCHFGLAYYHDEYVKVDGQWKIKFTGFEPIFEMVEQLSDTPHLQVTKNRFARDEEGL